VDEISGRERFLAWFEPEYRIVKMATPFFVKRFASMDWSILTPYACAHWDGKHLHFSAGVAKDQAPAEDAHDDLWRTYYKSIFNPARLKVKAMTTEMPKRYWKNLPEAAIIDELVASSSERMQRMMETEHLPAKPAPRNAYLKHLQELNEAENAEDSP
jgi:uracil-DNA glycosylase